MQMQEWLQDKKNLPIVVGAVAVLIILAGGFLYLQMRPSGGGSANQAATPPPDTTATMPGMPGMPGGMPPGMGTMPGMGGPPGAPAVGGAPAPTAEQTVQASAPDDGKPAPVEVWRSDPFAPLASGKQARKSQPPPRRLIVPSVGRLFPPSPPKPEVVNEKLIPQPPRRVAGILFSDRVNALLQTPDGWETVQPGGKLRDGTLVERIERDRVVLRTTDSRPRQIVIKLAASINPIQEELTSMQTDAGAGATMPTAPFFPGMPGIPPPPGAGGRRAM